MFIDVIVIPWQQSATRRTRRVALVSCDQCGVQFERPARYAVATYHFCNRTCLDRAHASDGALASVLASTNVSRYGTPNASSSDFVKEKRRQTFMSHFGVEHAWQALVVKEKIVASMIRNHGVRAAMQSPLIRSKVDFHASWRKQHETKKKNGSYRHSRVEHELYELLCSTYGDVERQVIVNDWSIDFYVKSVDTYVQLDGEYWHGLDRPIELIAEHKSPRDVQIHKKLLSDCAQVEWFKANEKRLVRITDKEFKRMNMQQLREVMK